METRKEIAAEKKRCGSHNAQRGGYRKGASRMSSLRGWRFWISGRNPGKGRRTEITYFLGCF